MPMPKLHLVNCMAVSLLSLVAVAVGYADDFSQIDMQNRGAVIFIKSIKQRKDGSAVPIMNTGTGFVVHKDGFVLTNSHVVPVDDPDYTIQISGSDRSRSNFAYPLSVVTRDAGLDIALVKFPDVGRAWQMVVIGDPSKVLRSGNLLTLGFPGDLDLSSAIGILSNNSAEKGRWQTTIPINYGNSGSPIFHTDGHVVAIAVGGRDDLNGVTFAIPIDYARPILSLIPGANSTTPLATNISQALLFYESADHEESKPISRDLCVAAGFHIDPASVSVRETTKNGAATTLKKVEVDPANQNCVKVDALVQGNGVQKFGPVVNHLGRGWLGLEIKVTASSANALPAL